MIRSMKDMKRKAFTITELAIAMLIMTTMAAAVALSTNTAKLTARMESERIVTQLYRLIETANRKHIAFRVLFDGTVQTESVPVEWQTPTTSQLHHIGYDREVKISRGCSIKNLNNMSSKSAHNLVYTIGGKGFDPPSMTLQVTGTDGSIYYIIIYVPGSRIRISDTRP